MWYRPITIEWDIFFCLETELTTTKKDNLNTVSDNLAYNVKYMHALC